MTEDQILYDLIVHEEWTQEPQLLSQVESYFWQYRGSLVRKLWKVTQGSVSYMLDTLKRQFRYQTSFGCPPLHFISLANNSLSWIISLSPDGSTVAVLQENVIEIRISENFSNVVSKCRVPTDKCPQWRKMTWSSDCTLLCYANSFGDVSIFDVTGLQRYAIPAPNTSSLNVPGTLSLAVSYLELKKKDGKNSWLLYVCTYQGLFNCYELGDSSCELFWSFSFLPFHANGVAAVVHDERNNLLIVADNYGRQPNMSDEGCYGSQCSISMWRFLNDSPFLTLVEDQGKGVKKVSGKDRIRNIMSWQKKDQETLKQGVYKMQLSSDGKMIVTLHINGRISLWHVPSMKLYKTWSKSEQPSGTDDSFGYQKEVTSSQVTDISWWSDEELILASTNGNITVVSSETLNNLLGESPEKFDAWPLLSAVVDGSVLILECEKRISDPSDKSNAAKKWLVEEDDEEVDSFRYRFKEITKQTLYFITESEHFLPTVKPPKILTNVYRLVCLKSTTPEELYARKIDMEHYGEALDLAKRFNLNTDLVYQRQWRKKRVTSITIHDYLTKIKDRYWVLDECLLRIPDDFESTESLLKYGLLGTSWNLLQRIDDDDADKLPFTYGTTQEHNAQDEESLEEKFTFKLSARQIRLCKYRWQLLQFLDRLSTYEVILGGSFKARDKFSSEYFSSFRSCNIVHHAIECARDGDSYSLEHLFSYHGKQVLPYWLPVISNFPETTKIRDYEPVLPEIGDLPDEPEIFPWLEKHHREEDWVEQENIVSQINSALDENYKNTEDLGAFIFLVQPELKRYCGCNSKKLLEEWFIERVHAIDERSGQIDKCCSLLNVGIKRGLSSLQTLHDEMCTWRTLVYEVRIESRMSAREFIGLSLPSKVRLLMSNSVEKTFVQDFERFLLPFLKRIQKKDFALRQTLLHDFLVDIAKSDLTCCLKLFKKCSSEETLPLLPDISEVMKVAIDCIYACKRDDQLEHMFDIIECLPKREEGVITPQMKELHDRVDDIEVLLSAAEILQLYSMPQTISYISQTRTDSQAAKDILQRLIKSVVMKGVRGTEINRLLESSIKLAKNVYVNCFDVKYCHQIFAENLLQSGCKENIQLASEILTTSRTRRETVQKEPTLTSALYALKYEVTVQLVLEAAREYFNAAASHADSSMELARNCLSLITDTPVDIQSELDLINALYLMQEFNVSLLPVQVRLCTDKLDLIDMCLEARTGNYKKRDKLLKMADLLQVCGQDPKERKGQVQTKIAESAFNSGDYTYAGIICVQLMEDNFAQAWWICRKVGECSKYTNYTIRKNLLSFALTYCPVYHIEEILNEKTMLETQILYEKLSLHAHASETDEDIERDGEDNPSILHKTKTTTKRLLSTVSGNKWIGNAMNWVKYSDDQNDKDSAQYEESVSNLQYHPFYKSLDKNLTDSKARGFSEFADYLEEYSESKSFNQLLFRSQKLSERRAEGTAIEDTNAAISTLARGAYSEESCLCLAYLMALSSDNEAQRVFESKRKNAFTFLFAAYHFALQMYVRQKKKDLPHCISDAYHIQPKQLLIYVISWLGHRGDSEDGDTKKQFLWNMNKLQDLMQAKMLKALDKGVDIERFAVDDEYKRETILGLAMTVEDEMMQTSMLLADKYDIESWNVMMAHVEFLFTDSGLKAKAIRELLNKWKVESYLKPHGDEVFQRMKEYVYPEINGKDHNSLLLFYVFLISCSSPTHVLEGTLSLDAHAKLLKKIKSAAPLNYKELVHGDSPLDVIKEVVDENNVHVLAKIAGKIPQSNGTFLSANKIFLAHVMRMFWRKAEGKNWMSHFETCQTFFNKLEIEDLVMFADSITFSEEAVDSFTQDIRTDITNRIMKYLRQQKGQDETKCMAEEGYEERMERYEKAVQHLQQSSTHLNTLNQEIHQEMLASENEIHRQFARRYDLSRGDVNTLHHLFKEMFVALESPSLVERMCSSCKNADLRGAFRDSVRDILEEMKTTRDLTSFSRLIKAVKEYNEGGGTVINHNDILLVVRPFCSDVNIDTEIKSSSMHILQASFHLPEGDMKLLLFYQSQAVIKPVWNIEIKEEDIETEQSRSQLYQKLLDLTSTTKGTDALEKLLTSWPPFPSSSVGNDSPWVQLLLQKIELKDDMIMSTLRHAHEEGHFEEQAYHKLYKKLEGRGLLAWKLLLISGKEVCIEQCFSELAVQKEQVVEYEIDDEFVNILLETKTIHRTVHTSIYPLLVHHLLQSSSSDVIDHAISQLQSNGCEVEASCLFLKSSNAHSSFFQIKDAMDFFSWKWK